MARILELVLIANALGGIAGYLGFKVRRAKQATKAGVNKAAGMIGVEVYHEDDAEPLPPDPRLVKELTSDGSAKPKKSVLARVGETIR
jgi:hypothetical protein